MQLDGRRAPVWAGVDTHKDTHALCVLDELSLLFARRELLVRQRTALSNHVDGEVSRAPEAVRARLAGLSGAARMDALASCRPRAGSDGAAWLTCVNISDTSS